MRRSCRDGKDIDLFGNVQMGSIQCYFVEKFKAYCRFYSFFPGNLRIQSKGGLEMNFVYEECSDVIRVVLIFILPPIKLLNLHSDHL